MERVGMQTGMVLEGMNPMQPHYAHSIIQRLWILKSSLKGLNSLVTQNSLIRFFAATKFGGVAV